MIKRELPYQEIWLPNGRQLVINKHIDTTPSQLENMERKQEIGRGFSDSKEMQEIASIPAEVFFSDPEWQEWYKTRDKTLLKRLCEKHPWVRTSTGGI